MFALKPEEFHILYGVPFLSKGNLGTKQIKLN